MKFALPLTILAALVSAHGYVESPPARQVGPAAVAVCGKEITDDIRRDNSSHIEGLPELAAEDDDYRADRCNLWLCRGLQFADNMDYVQSWHPGQVVEVKVRLTIPHDGSANVSIVDTATNKPIGLPLVAWATGYANEREFYGRTLPVNNTDFTVTLPDVRRQCATAGACVLQWWWFANRARQSYESCIDFTMSGQG
ncbi:hypothetical protein GQ53DRAFT_820561 [Thozetella sp. PMI_491]|nr:hypothetical protein GQ53DRAFT_820561 [Thozetella sp. PMI_491]